MKTSYQRGSVSSKAKNDIVSLSDIAAIANSAEHGTKIQQIWNAIQSAEKKEKISALKNALGWFIPAGQCDFGHADETLHDYTGIVTLDFDGPKENPEIARKTKEIAEKIVKNVISAKENGSFSAIIAIAISPSLCGFKVFVATDNENKTNHYKAAETAANYFFDECKNQNITIDKSIQLDKCSKALSMVHYIPARMWTFDAANPLHVQNTTTPKTAKGDTKNTQIKTFAPPTYQELSEIPQPYLNAHKRLITAAHGKTIEGYSEYLRYLIAYTSLFGKTVGPKLAWQLLSQSEHFNASKFRRVYEQKINSIKTIKTSGEWILRLSEKYKTTKYQIPQNMFLADFLKANNMLNIETLANKSIVCPTGSGKTWAIAELAKSAKIVFVAPTRALAAQAAADANGIVWYGGNKGVDILADALMNNFIATTYHSLPDLISQNSEITERILVIDEVHNIAAAAAPDYMQNTIEKLISCVNFFQNIITLTATPCKNPIEDARNLDILEFEKAKNKITANAIKVTGKASLTETACAIAVDAIRNGETVIIYLKNKAKKLRKAKAFLAKHKIPVTILNADTKESEDFSLLVNDGKIKNKCVIATSVIKEGVSIRNVEKVRYVLVGGCGLIEFKQLIARVRGNAQITADILYKKTSENGVNFAGEQLALIRNITTDAIAKLNAATTCASDAQALRNIAPMCAYYDQKTNSWKINETLLYYSAFQKESIFYSSNVFALAEKTKDLADWNFSEINTEKCSDDDTEQIEKELEEKEKSEYTEGLRMCVSERAIIRMRFKGGGFALAARIVSVLSAILGGATYVAREIALSLLKDAGNVAKAKNLGKQIRLWQAMWCGLETAAKDVIMQIAGLEGTQSLPETIRFCQEIFSARLKIELDDAKAKKLLKAIFDIEYLHGGKRQTVRLTGAWRKLEQFKLEIMECADAELQFERELANLLRA